MIEQVEKTSKELETLDIKVRKFKEKTGLEFDKFYKSYFPKLKFYLYKMCGDTFLSEEAATECIIKSLNNIDLYDPSKFEIGKKASFSTWLYKISRNHMIQILSKRKNNMISLNSDIDDEGTPLIDVISEKKNYTIDNEEDLHYELAKKKTEVVLKNINNLSDSHRDAIIMREINKLSYRDISYAMGYNEEYVSTVDDNYSVDLSEVKPIKINYVKDVFNNTLSYTAQVSDDVITSLKIEDFYIGKVLVSYTIPENENTIKSKIRCGRLKLEELTKEEFNKLNNLYL